MFFNSPQTRSKLFATAGTHASPFFPIRQLPLQFAGRHSSFIAGFMIRVAEPLHYRTELVVLFYHGASTRRSQEDLIRTRAMRLPLSTDSFQFLTGHLSHCMGNPLSVSCGSLTQVHLSSKNSLIPTSPSMPSSPTLGGMER